MREKVRNGGITPIAAPTTPPQSKQSRDVALQAWGAASILQFMVCETYRDLRQLWRFRPLYDPECTTWANVRSILMLADWLQKGGPVAYHLIGAKLQLRFPEEDIPNERYSAADEQTGRRGDFQVRDTAFHVTVSPMPPVYEKCLRNIRAGSRVYLLVPEDVRVGALQNAQTIARDRIAVESIEYFIANNIEELSWFSKDRLVSGFKRLLETYNRRVDAIEMDKSLLIEIPPSLS